MIKKIIYFYLILKLKNIDLIDTVLVQEFNNKDHIYLRIKYLGKLDKIMNQLNKENVKLKASPRSVVCGDFIIMNQLTLKLPS